MENEVRVNRHVKHIYQDGKWKHKTSFPKIEEKKFEN